MVFEGKLQVMMVIPLGKSRRGLGGEGGVW